MKDENIKMLKSKLLNLLSNFDDLRTYQMKQFGDGHFSHQSVITNILLCEILIELKQINKDTEPKEDIIEKEPKIEIGKESDLKTGNHPELIGTVEEESFEPSPDEMYDKRHNEGWD